MLAQTLELGWQSDGWIRFIEDGYNLARGPLGVLLYLPLAPVYWLVPAARRAAYLVVTSLLLALATLGPAYAATLVGLALLSLGIIRGFAVPSRSRTGVLLLAAMLAGLLWCPQPPWLPAAGQPEPLYFYLHWAGIAYLFLRAYHVLADVTSARMAQPKAGEFFAYLLFAPTLRMGPIYRYRAFVGQLAEGPGRHRDLLAAGGRLVTGLLRLGVLAAIMKKLPLTALFEEPQKLGTAELVAGVYWAAMSFYLWFSGYVDLSVAVGRVLGFAVPDNFNYPWRAANIAEFWQRWHITLSEWLRDYLFLPMVRHRWPVFLSYIATFLFCGLWHAPLRCYILWGLSQGVGLAVRRYWLDYWKGQRRRRSALYQALAWAGLAGGPLGAALAWLVTFHYSVLTLMIGVDVEHAGLRVFRELLRTLGIW